MKWLQQLGIAGLLLIPALACADVAVTTRCMGAHVVRANGTEMRFTLIELDNADLVNAVTIQRFTVRDYDGSVIHDSGPEVSVPLPIQAAFSPPLDLNTTPVPPGAVEGLATSDIWGLFAVNPVAPANARSGTQLSITVKATKRGNPHLFRVHAREITRDRVALAPPAPPGSFGLGAERSANDPKCYRLDGEQHD